MKGAAAHDASTVLILISIITVFLGSAISEAPTPDLRAAPART